MSVSLHVLMRTQKLSFIYAPASSQLQTGGERRQTPAGKVNACVASLGMESILAERSESNVFEQDTMPMGVEA